MGATMLRSTERDRIGARLLAAGWTHPRWAFFSYNGRSVPCWRKGKHAMGIDNVGRGGRVSSVLVEVPGGSATYKTVAVVDGPVTGRGWPERLVDELLALVPS
mgnify:CR=1 FL=1